MRPCANGLAAFGVAGLSCPARPDKLLWYNYGKNWATKVVLGANYWAIRSKKEAIKKAKQHLVVKAQLAKGHARARRGLGLLPPRVDNVTND